MCGVSRLGGRGYMGGGGVYVSEFVLRVIVFIYRPLNYPKQAKKYNPFLYTR